MARTALLAGATGLIGGHLLTNLLQSSDFERVIALTRRPLAAKPRVESRVVSFDALKPDECTGADVVFCALGTTIKKAGSQEAFRHVDFGYVKSLAECSCAAGAKQFAFVSSVGADPASRNFYLRTKGEIEQALAPVPFAAVHIFRPSLLLGKRRESRPGEQFAIKLAPLFNPLLVSGLKKYRAIEAAQVAHAMIAATARNATGVHAYEYDQIVRLDRT
jgi:uncharacterized protein YbjT (DUF2867 family)